jgi:hypothetical protein
MEQAKPIDQHCDRTDVDGFQAWAEDHHDTAKPQDDSKQAGLR